MTCINAFVMQFSCGWIRSKDGKWMKDPNVEFDSDDEAETVITSELSVTLAKR